MSERLDGEVLGLVSELIAAGRGDDVELVRLLWRERGALVSAFRDIRDWDLAHSEALSLERVQEIIRTGLDLVGEL